MADQIRATPRNPFFGLFSDAINLPLDYMSDPRRTQQMQGLASFIRGTGVPSTLENLSYDPSGRGLFTGAGGLGGTTRLRPEVINAALTVAPGVGPAARMTKGLPVGMSIKSIDDLAAKYPDVKIDASVGKNDLNLSRIIVPKDMRSQGIGTQVMNDLSEYADNIGKRITLTPSSDFGGNIKRLKEFYKDLGFVENKGKNKDFSTMEAMYREPKPFMPAQALRDVSYRGSHLAPNVANYGATIDDLGKIMPADVYSSRGISLYGSGDKQVDAEWFAAAYKAKGNPDKMIEIFRAVPKGVKDINEGDFVTTSRTYAKKHGEAALDGNYDIVSMKVKANTLSSEGYPYEFGYNTNAAKPVVSPTSPMYSDPFTNTIVDTTR